MRVLVFMLCATDRRHTGMRMKVVDHEPHSYWTSIEQPDHCVCVCQSASLVYVSFSQMTTVR